MEIRCAEWQQEIEYMKYKKNYKNLIPYDKEIYIEYLDDESESITSWQGISVQLTERILDEKLSQFSIEFMEIIKEVLLINDLSDSWIVSHDDKDMEWLPEREKNLHVLRSKFEENNIKSNSKGALVLNNDELLECLEDLILYPYVLSYKNIDISNGLKPFIIKTTSHLTVDFLSKKRNIIDELLSLSCIKRFKVVKYRGTV